MTMLSSELSWWVDRIVIDETALGDRFDLDLEWGPLVSTVGPAQWLYGVVVGVDISKTGALMVELHGTSRTNFTDDELAVNFGIRQKLNDHCIFIGSLGHELRSSQSRALIGYAGVQLLF